MNNTFQVVAILILFALVPILFFNVFTDNSYSKLCYVLSSKSGDNAMMVVKVLGSKVNGEFDWKPGKVSSTTVPKKGPFTGKIYTANTDQKTMSLQTLWDVYDKGKVTEEELRVIIGLAGAKPGFGPMQKNDWGVYVYSDPDRISYGPNLLLTKCE